MKTLQRARAYARRNPRVLFLLYLPTYLTWFFILEHTITADYYVSYMPLDDAIPFVPAFVVVYILWYPYLFAPAAYLYFRDPPAFVRYCWFYMGTFTISLLVCTVLPNGQDLRPADPGGGVFGWILGIVYGFDTNTNVLPSMHVVGCAAVALAALDTDRFGRLRWPLVLMGALICASTVLVKQHSFLDVIWGAAVAVPVWFCVYRAPGLLKNGTKRRPRAS